MAEFTEPNEHIRFNKNGSPVLAEKDISIIQIGISHEKGVSKEWLLEQYAISSEQLEAALAYFYENREAIRDFEEKTKQIIPDSKQREALEALRKKRLSGNQEN
jgi:uncharacterized protein (DUF433 family)